MTYLNKYTCSECFVGVWQVGNPLQCQRCAGTMVETEQGTTPLPTGNYYRHDGGSLQFDWDEFNAWWEDKNVR